MIFSSADILSILGKNEVIRLSAKLSIVDGKPPLSGREGIYIYVNRFPTLQEFEATWQIWIEADEEDDLIVAELQRLLPRTQVTRGLMTTVSTTEFRSENTQRAPEAPKPVQAQVDLTQYEERFQALVEDVQDQMLLVSSGRPGKDGRDGRDGQDGKDIDAAETELFDLKDVGKSILPIEKGQVLTWDGGKWTNLYIRQVQTILGKAGGSNGSGENVIVADAMPSTREDGSQLQEGDQWWSSITGVMYIWYVDADSSQWVQSSGNGGGGGGVKTLSDLTDVDAETPNNGDVIAYNSVSGNWETIAAPPADISGNSIGDLSDVTIDPALLEKDFGLVYDGVEWVVASPPVLIEGHNQTGGTLVKGTPVYVAGTHNSGKPLLAAADADGAGTYPAIGLVHEDIASGIDGHVMLSGVLANVDTSAYSAGDALYLSSAPGSLTSVRPTAATEKVQKVGIVTRVHATAGSILIIGAGRTNDINNELVALIGAGDKDAVDLGTFSGTTISDNADIKEALQELETAVEAVGSGGIPEAPQDGNYYVRQNGAWVNLVTALSALEDRIVGGGNFTTGASDDDTTDTVDGGVFT